MKDQIFAVYDKSESTLTHMSGINGVNEFMFGNSAPVIVTENGFRFKIDWATGQKTGFFIDRERTGNSCRFHGKGKVYSTCLVIQEVFLYMRCKMQLLYIPLTARGLSGTCKGRCRLNFGDDVRHGAFQLDAFEYLQNIKVCLI